MAFLASRISCTKFVPLGNDFVNLNKVRVIRPIDENKLNFYFKPQICIIDFLFCRSETFDNYQQIVFKDYQERQRWLSIHIHR